MPVRFGRYELLSRIDAGGFAEVFKARLRGVEGFERVVAIKRVLPHIAEDRDLVEMFIEEAKIAVQLQHPCIAQIFDLGREEGAYFIAMEYVHGKDLRALWKLQREAGVALPLAGLVYVFIRVCDALHYAHFASTADGRELNVIHRDVSPQNVLVSYAGDVKVIDFGLAKAAGRAIHTQVGVVKGKLAYMSPEQVHGQLVDRRSDIFAVGVCLWEMITGVRLFGRTDDLETIRLVRTAEVQSTRRLCPWVPVELDQIVLRALSRGPDERYPTALEMLEALRGFAGTLGERFEKTHLAEWMRRAFGEPSSASREVALEDELPSPASSPHSRPSGSGRPHAGTGRLDFLEEASTLEGRAVLLEELELPEPPLEATLPYEHRSPLDETLPFEERSTLEGEQVREGRKAVDARQLGLETFEEKTDAWRRALEEKSTLEGDEAGDAWRKEVEAYRRAIAARPPGEPARRPQLMIDENPTLRDEDGEALIRAVIEVTGKAPPALTGEKTKPGRRPGGSAPHAVVPPSGPLPSEKPTLELRPIGRGKAPTTSEPEESAVRDAPGEPGSPEAPAERSALRELSSIRRAETDGPDTPPAERATPVPDMPPAPSRSPAPAVRVPRDPWATPSWTRRSPLQKGARPVEGERGAAPVRPVDVAESPFPRDEVTAAEWERLTRSVQSEPTDAWQRRAVEAAPEESGEEDIDEGPHRDTLPSDVLEVHPIKPPVPPDDDDD